MTTRNEPGGYGHLLSAFEEAASVTDAVTVTILGIDGGTWDVDPRGRRAGGDLEICDGRKVSEDSTLVGSFGGVLLWLGGHGMEDGRRTERFNHDGVAMTATWAPSPPRNQGRNP